MERETHPGDERRDELSDELYQELPEALIGELKAADSSVSTITARADREIASLARAHFAARRRRRPRFALGAIAASALIGLVVVQIWLPATQVSNERYVDIDNSGRLDIADVLLLARTREKAGVSQADIDAFALHVVALNRNEDT